MKARKRGANSSEQSCCFRLIWPLNPLKTPAYRLLFCALWITWFKCDVHKNTQLKRIGFKRSPKLWRPIRRPLFERGRQRASLRLNLEFQGQARRYLVRATPSSQVVWGNCGRDGATNFTSFRRRSGRPLSRTTGRRCGRWSSTTKYWRCWTRWAASTLVASFDEQSNWPTPALAPSTFSCPASSAR